MALRSLVAPLLAAMLLLYSTGCSKKDALAAKPAAGVGSYLYNGQLIHCTAAAHVLLNVSGTDFLHVELTTTPQPAAGSQVMRLVFIKNTSQPPAAYVPLQLAESYSGAAVAIHQVDSFTLTNFSNGSFSGTFSSVSPYSTIAFSVTNGVFTNVPL